MKKLALVLMLALFMTACSKEQATTEAEQTTEVATTEVATEVTTETPKEAGMIGGEEKGEGILYIENESGTSENGNILYIMEGDYTVLQIGVYAEGMDGTQPTVFYVDGKELTKEQLSHSQTSLQLQAEHLTPGIHNVEAIQGDTFYRLMQYEVK